jgi:hypothetical protein
MAYAKKRKPTLLGYYFNMLLGYTLTVYFSEAARSLRELLAYGTEVIF